MASNLYVNICKQMAIICWLWTGLALCWFLEIRTKQNNIKQNNVTCVSKRGG